MSILLAIIKRRVLKMNTTVSLKRLTESYTAVEIFGEANKKFTLFHEDAMSLLDLTHKIRNSPENISSGRDILCP